MILVDESDGRVRAQAFLFPAEPADHARLADFLVTIDEIEQRTGFDFLERFGMTSLDELPPLDVDVAARLAEEGGDATPAE